MFGLQDKVLAMIGGGVAMVLAAALAFTVVSKNAAISTLRDNNRELTATVASLTSDYAQCSANGIMLEKALRQQGEAVEAARVQGAARIAELQRTADRARDDAAAAKSKADRILGTRGTGDACKDADALIMGEVQ